eukprot:CFRG8077T1
MAALIQRVAQYLANEVITKSLARSKSFQKFAQQTHGHVSKMSEAGEKHVETFDVQKTVNEAGLRMGRFIGNASTATQNLSQNASKTFAQAQKLLQQQADKIPK